MPKACSLLLLLSGCHCASHERPPGIDAGVAPDAMPDAPDDAGHAPACGQITTHFAFASALSPDGALYAYSHQGLATVLDAETGLYLRTLGTPQLSGTTTHEMVFSDDGSKLFLATMVGARVLDVADGRVLVDVALAESLRSVSGGVVAARAEIAILEYRSELVLVDLADGSTRTLPITLETRGRNFDVSPDGSLLAIGQEESLVIVRVDDGSVVRTLPLGNSNDRVVFSPDGSLVAVTHGGGGTDHVLAEVARVDGSGSLGTVTDAAAPPRVVAATWAPDGRTLHLLRSFAEIVNVSVGEGLTLERRIRLPIAGFRSLIATEQAFYGGADHAWRTEADGTLAWVHAGDFTGDEFKPIAFTPSGDVLAGGIVWNVETAVASRVLDGLRGRAIVREDAIAWIDDDGAHVEDGEQRVYPLPFDPDALAMDDETLTIADAEEVAIVDRADGAMLARYSHGGGGRSILLLATSADGRLMVLGEGTESIRILVRMTGEDVTPGERLPGFNGSTGAAFLRDGQLALANGANLRVLDPATGAVREMESAVGAKAVAELPSGDLVVSDLSGLSIVEGRMLTVRSRVEGPMHPPFAYTTAIATSPDGARVAQVDRRGLGIYCLDP
jgi:hypothetical protein